MLQSTFSFPSDKRAILETKRQMESAGLIALCNNSSSMYSKYKLAYTSISSSPKVAEDKRSNQKVTGISMSSSS